MRINPVSASVWGLGAVFLALHLPFLGQALMIDDGTFVDQALQVLEEPARPYSFTIHLSRPQPFFDYMANPPGQAFWLAGVIGLFGRAEPVVHGAAMLFAALAVSVMYLLGREITGRGFFPALLFLSMPAFLMSSHTVMSDVPAASFYLLAVYLFVRGIDEDRISWLVGSGVAAGLASLLEYSSLSVFLLMALYVVLQRRWRFSTAAPFAIGGGIFAAWCLASYLAYGRVHIAAAYAVESLQRTGTENLIQIAAVLIGVGGATVLAPCLLVWAIRVCFVHGRAWGVFAAVAAVAGFAVALPRHASIGFEYDTGNRMLGGLLLAAGIATVVCVAARGVAAVREFVSGGAGRQDAARTLLLVAWFLGFLALDALTLFATPKYLVPALAPLVLLLVGREETATREIGWRRGALIAATATFALALGSAGASQVAAHKRWVTNTLPDLAGARPIWFVGHWTIRFYAEHAGQRYLGQNPGPADLPATGDLVYVVRDAVWHRPPARVRLQRVAMRSEAAILPLHVSNPLVGASYWSHHAGVMPYVFSTEPRSVVEIGRAVVE